MYPMYMSKGYIYLIYLGKSIRRICNKYLQNGDL